MVEKIASKKVNATTPGGKVIRTEEEEEDDSEAIKKQAKKGKDQAKIKAALKANKEEEKFAGGDVFGQAAENQSTAVARAQRLAELKAKQEARKQEVIKSQQQKK